MPDLKAATVTFLVGFWALAACASAPVVGSPRWGAFPEFGIHVSGTGVCGSRKGPQRHDVIVSVDGATSEHEMLDALNDSDAHEMTFFDHFREQLITMTVRLEPWQAEECDLVPMSVLWQTPARGRSNLWGFALKPTWMYTDERKWEAPLDLREKSAHVIVHLPDPLEEVVATLHAAHGQHPIMTFLLRDTPAATEFQPEPWSTMEVQLANKFDTIQLATASWPTRRGQESKNGILGKIKIAPSVIVVDCNGIVRWHSDQYTGALAGVSLSLAAELEEALEFANELMPCAAS